MATPNKTLIIGLSLPVVTLIVVIASLYLPRFFVHPAYDFLYAIGTDYEYSVENTILTKKQSGYRLENYTPKEPTLHIYHVDTDKSEQISYEEAQQLKLDANQVSPDKLKVEYHSNYHGFFRNNRGAEYFLTGRFYRKALNSNNLSFIGWIINK